MSAGSEFQTEGAATLKLREAKVVQTRGTDNRLRTCRSVVTKKRAEVSRLRGVESVTSQCGKCEFSALVVREPMMMLQDSG